jgi:hypothetical protein
MDSSNPDQVQNDFKNPQIKRVLEEIESAQTKKLKTIAFQKFVKFIEFLLKQLKSIILFSYNSKCKPIPDRKKLVNASSKNT